MVKKNILNLKSNKGFTMQDLVLAIAIFALFSVIIGTGLVVTFKVQADSQVDEVGTLYAVQIAEYIDKISFDEVENGMGDSMAKKFNIPTNFTVTINVSDYKPELQEASYVKDVDINLEYNFNNDSRNIRIQKLKIKEL